MLGTVSDPGRDWGRVRRGLGLLAGNKAGTHLYLGTDDGVLVIEIGPLKTVARIEVDSVWGLAVCQDRDRLYTVRGKGGVAEIDTATHEVVRTLASGGEYDGIAVDREGARLYLSSREGAPTVTVISLHDGSTIATLKLAEPAHGPAGVRLVLSPDGARLYAYNPVLDGSLAMVDTTALSVAARAQGLPYAVWPDEDGQRVYGIFEEEAQGRIMSAAGLATDGNFPTTTPSNTVDNHAIHALSKGPDGQLLIATEYALGLVTPKGKTEWDHRPVQFTAACSGVVAGARTAYRNPTPARPSLTVAALHRAAPTYLPPEGWDQMRPNWYQMPEAGERIPETTEVIKGSYLLGQCHIWHPAAILGDAKRFYLVPFWGVYVNGDDIIWDTPANTTVPPKARLVARHSGKCVEIGGETDDSGDGATAQQGEWLDADHQKWALEPLSDGYYRIVAQHSGQALEATDSGTDNGTRIRPGEWNEGHHQQWRPERSTTATTGWSSGTAARSWNSPTPTTAPATASPHASRNGTTPTIRNSASNPSPNLIFNLGVRTARRT
ncbi:ricin-type beta-trefoil lectin protein [Streptomyces sp. CEV 2-1]|nr:ricin-type beta-trefoil lectin protein [Streptomyces sp. CEV 2-1]